MRRNFASSPFFVLVGFDFVVSDGAFSWASEGRQNAAHAMAINAKPKTVGLLHEQTKLLEISMGYRSLYCNRMPGLPSASRQLISV